VSKYVIFVGTLEQWLDSLAALAILFAAVYFSLTVRRFRRTVLIPSEKELRTARSSSPSSTPTEKGE
jgi:hypothetical protein